MKAGSRWAPLAAAVAVVAGLGTSCGSGSGSQSADTTSTTLESTTTSTTVASILPSEGTIPLADLATAQRTDELMTTAQRAFAFWKDAPVECYPSRAEAVAARDQFARVATYLAAVRSSARRLADAQAFKEAIAIEAEYRTYAASRPFPTCGAPTPAEPSGTKSTTTVPGGTTQGLAAGGISEITLVITGTPAVDQEFTITDPGAACDGFGANTTFLVSAQDALGNWAITDVIVDTTGATSTKVVPTRAGPGAIEYLAYCGTLDKRHGVVTYRVRPTGDTTTSTPSPTTTDATAPLVVVDLPTNDAAVVVDPRATEVAIEPESVAAFLAANGADGGIVIARLNMGDWVALRPGQVSWVPAGPGDDGLETKIVGAKTPADRTIRVTSPTTTTTTQPETTTSAMPIATAQENGNGSSDTDTTLVVIVALLALAALTVVFARLRLRR